MGFEITYRNWNADKNVMNINAGAGERNIKRRGNFVAIEFNKVFSGDKPCQRR